MVSWAANDKSEEQGERPEAAEKNQEGGSTKGEGAVSSWVFPMRRSGIAFVEP